jgi:hypothetical protein
VRRKNDANVHCLGKSKGRTHPPVREDVVRRLEDFYRPENEKFFKMIHRRFHWF